MLMSRRKSSSKALVTELVSLHSKGLSPDVGFSLEKIDICDLIYLRLLDQLIHSVYV